MSSTVLARLVLVPLVLVGVSLNGCAAYRARRAARHAQDGSNACETKGAQMEARIRTARTQSPEPGARFSGSWKCVADGYVGEYWRMNQSGNRVTGVASAPTGNTWSVEGAMDGHTAVLKSSYGTYYALEIDGGSASGEVLVHEEDTGSCVLAHSVCTRI